MLEALWTKFVGPVLLWPLLCHRGATPLWAAGGRGSQRSNSGVSAAAVNAAVAAVASEGPAAVRRSPSSSTQLPSGDCASASACGSAAAAYDIHFGAAAEGSMVPGGNFAPVWRRPGDTGAVGTTAALLVLERLLLVISESALLRPVLVALLAGGRADVMAASAANMPAWASAGALLRAQDSQSRDYGRQLAVGGGGGDQEEVTQRCPQRSMDV